METVTITVENGIRLSFSYALKLRIGELIKAVPGYRWEPGPKQWVWPATAAHANELNDTLFSISGITRFTINAPPEFKALVDSYRSESAAIETKYVDYPDEIPNWKHTEPSWNHQRQAYHYILNMRSVYLRGWMGVGKTGIALMKMRNRGFKRMIVVCPKAVMDVWPIQIKRFLPDYDLKVVILQGSIEKRAQIIQTTRAPHILFITNFEGFGVSDRLVNEFANWEPDFLVLDEAHRIKQWDGKNGKALRRLARRVESHCELMAMSGTPMAHSPLDIWAQMNFLDPNVLGDSWFSFLHRYAIKSPYHKGIIGYQNMPDLMNRLSRIMFTIDQSVLRLPELVESERTYTMAPAVEKEYTALWQYFYSTILEELEYGQKITALLKCQQVCSGFIKDHDTLAEVHTEKVKLLTDILEDLDRDAPVVIFCRFSHEIAMIRKAVKEDVAEVSGQHNTLAEFQAGEKRIIIVQIQAGSLGIDLTRASTAIFYSLDWSLSNFDQAKARVYRPGQTKTTHLIYLLAARPNGKPSIDQDILSALRARKDFVRAVMDGQIKDS